MNDTVAVAGDAHPDVEDHPGEHASDRQFVKVFLGLVVVTAVEVGLVLPAVRRETTAGRRPPSTGAACSLMMGFKFFIIASYFMHLRFDNKPCSPGSSTPAWSWPSACTSSC